ncbi:MAG: hypothetical protein IIA65_05985 [Planctomycetes bacterium]|nr:hypothetical protein [Planctomycetota bacterium]
MSVKIPTTLEITATGVDESEDPAYNGSVVADPVFGGLAPATAFGHGGNQGLPSGIGSGTELLFRV